jgi:D-alanyl-D-alanine carboxypeptidase
MVALACGCGATGGPPAKAGEPGKPPWLQADTDAIRSAGTVGVQTLVHLGERPGSVAVAASGTADRRTGRAVSPSGYFRIGSMNKMLVAIVVLQLAGQHRLSLDDTVERWLPGVVEGNGNDGRVITIRELLQHTSGISDAAFPSPETAQEYRQHRFDVRRPEQIVAAAMKFKPLSAPGREWHYSNTGYLILGLIIQRVTGNPWYDEVQARIVRPLGLRHTIWPGGQPGLPTPHSQGYTRFAPEAGGLVDTTQLVDADASGGYLSTTADLDRILRALFDGTLLTAWELSQMRRTVPLDKQTEQLWPGARYGLGIFARPLPCGGTAWTPAGDQLGFSTRTGVTGDGSRSAVVSMSTLEVDSLDSAKAQDRAAGRLIFQALCPPES